MSSIVKETFPIIKNITYEKSDEISKIRNSFPSIADRVIVNEIEKFLKEKSDKSFSSFTQGDLRLISIYIEKQPKLQPKIRYHIGLKSRKLLGIDEIQNLKRIQ